MVGGRRGGGIVLVLTALWSVQTKKIVEDMQFLITLLTNKREPNEERAIVQKFRELIWAGGRGNNARAMLQ